MSLSFKGLKILPKDLDADTERIECQYNLLKTLTHLPIAHLKYLNCSGNQLRHLQTLPDTLEILICSNNNLTRLNQLPCQLKHLECQNNHIKQLNHLPDTLTYLNCHSNPIKYLTRVPVNLETLWCQHCPIKEINLPLNLKQLDITTKYLKHELVVPESISLFLKAP